MPPKWIPTVRRPWNPSYREVWDNMTHEEKQESFLFDCVVFLVVAVLFAVLTA